MSGCTPGVTPVGTRRRNTVPNHIRVVEKQSGKCGNRVPRRYPDIPICSSYMSDMSTRIIRGVPKAGEMFPVEPIPVSVRLSVIPFIRHTLTHTLTQFRALIVLPSGCLAGADRGSRGVRAPSTWLGLGLGQGLGQRKALGSTKPSCM